MDDGNLVARVTDELCWDPKVDHAESAVSADDGAVRLRGTVGSTRQTREANKAADPVYGVRSVTDELSARVLAADKRDDGQLRGRVVCSRRHLHRRPHPRRVLITGRRLRGPHGDVPPQALTPSLASRQATHWSCGPRRRSDSP
jgi:hypothetical protein